ncbi:periplasmic heavy metal sensor [Sphingomonas sp. AR_OL41]|uniref:periplasmic heavy metal sensor n=1 Tax=Sphingomonas sp. AR_OL41 TaxID=3042729 RepID=UPI00248082D7|nr:periplasmic heavy metal sensor [Sphingomonas sp. AR_OL41]MDH7972805.1 periplasmic heavy metal sensor [Sphingomonas sp. AR_OL41]
MNILSQRQWMLAGILSVTAGTAGLIGAGPALSIVAGHQMPGHGHAAMDPAAVDAHVDQMFSTVLPDATAEQKSRLKVLARAVHEDLRVTHAQFGETHQRLHALLLQPSIDRAALESLRVAQMREIDTTSKRVVTALADAAEILSPAQRARLAAHLQAHDKEGAVR